MKAGRCFFHGRPGIAKCRGRMTRAHWIKQQTIRNRFPLGAMRLPGEGWTRVPRKGLESVDVEPGVVVEYLPLEVLTWDRRVWTPMCKRHHWDLDHVRKLKVLRRELPAELEEFAADFDLGWWLDREYGVAEAAPLTVRDG